MSHLMMQAELDGIVCSGARRGDNSPMRCWMNAPHAKILKREDALAGFTGRYFMSRGPSTVQDFSKWSGLTTADAGAVSKPSKASCERKL
jgi:hypothetical protein